MTRFWIHHVLPVLLCLVPVGAGCLVFLAIPVDARNDYLDRVSKSPIDWLILICGAILFAWQILLTWKALHWKGAPTAFDERGDKWIENLAQAAEWFPLLGLIGTVAAILQTFGSFKAATNPTPQQIIREYAPAITATGSGLFMALMNILPQWIARVGRDLIRSLAGEANATPMVPLTPVPPQDPPYGGMR
ncbi:MAG: MotA/TolQ/ExbB proton channel family protein [Fimbriiglobus sp.]